MTDRHSRGASRSSNCFQTSSAFGFLAFIVRSRVGIRGVGSPGRAGIFDQKLKVKSGKKEKGRNCGQATAPPEIIIPELKHFASPNFKKFYAPGPRNTDHAPSCHTGARVA